MKRILLHIVLLIGWLGAFAQNGYKVVQYNADDGLPSSLTHSVFQDSRDFIWVSTDAGLSRFDGRKFVNYTSPEGLYGNLIMGIDEDDKHDLWIGTAVGLFRFNGHRFYKELPRLGVITEIKCVNDKIWIGTKTGLYLYQGGKLTSYTSKDGLNSSKINCLLPMADGSILIGTSYGISKYNNRFMKFWTSLDDNDDGNITCMAEDDAGRIWFCTVMGKILYYYKGYVYQPTFDKSYSSPKSIIVDGNTVMIAHDHHFTIFKDGLYQTNFDGFISRTEVRTGIFKAIRDHEDNFWFATGSGLMGVKRTEVQSYKMPERRVQRTIKPGEPEEEMSRLDISVEHMFRIKGDSGIYITNPTGVYKLYNDKVMPAFDGKPYQLGEMPLLAKAEDGTYFFGSTLDVLVMYQKGKYTKLGKDYTGYTAAAHNNDGLWLAGTNKLTLYQKGAFRDYTINSDTISYRTSSMVAYNNGLLLGTQAGLLYFKDSIFHSIDIPLMESPVVIRDIYKYDDRTFLIATKGYGLIEISMQGNKARLLRALTTKSGLNTNFIHSVMVKDSSVWLTGLNGVYKIGHFNSSNYSIEYLNRDDGLLDNNWNFSPIEADDRGYIYVGGSKGLMKLHSSISMGSDISQKTYITGVRVNNTDFQWGMSDTLVSFSGVPSFYEFQPNQNSLTFYFTSVNLHRPSRTKYQYVLHGYSNDKVITTNDYVSINNLPPGRYIFKVRSTSNQKFTDENFATFSFEINTPFWKTWWFRTMLLLLVALIVYTIYRWRLSEQIRKQRRELEVQRQINETKILAFQARMNPHFIFNSLNSIQYFITNNDKLGTLNYLSKFARLLRQILDNTAESKITLEKEIEMLRSYIEMEQLRFEQKFNYKLTIDDDVSVSEIRIPGMVIQPFIENAILHGLLHKEDEGFLRIHFRASERQVICIVEDNGIGRKRSRILNEKKITQHKSHGTDIAINRLMLHNDAEKGIVNNVIFEDIEQNGEPAGTKVIIYIPIL